MPQVTDLPTMEDDSSRQWFDKCNYFKCLRTLFQIEGILSIWVEHNRQ